MGEQEGNVNIVNFLSLFSASSLDLVLLSEESVLFPLGLEVKGSTRHAPPGWQCQGAFFLL